MDLFNILTQYHSASIELIKTPFVHDFIGIIGVAIFCWFIPDYSAFLARRRRKTIRLLFVFAGIALFIWRTT